MGRLCLVLLTAAAAAALASYGLLPRKDYHCRITVEVMTPVGWRTGASVVEIHAGKRLKLTSEEHAGTGYLLGDAVIVDLPSGPLFVLLDRAGAGQPLDVEITRALSSSREAADGDYVDLVGRVGRATGTTAALPASTWPMMMRFRNLRQPSTGELVDPASLGVRQITVAVTNDPVTRGIEHRLPWLDAMDGFKYNGTAFNDIYPVEALALRRH